VSNTKALFGVDFSITSPAVVGVLTIDGEPIEETYDYLSFTPNIKKGTDSYKVLSSSTKRFKNSIERYNFLSKNILDFIVSCTHDFEDFIGNTVDNTLVGMEDYSMGSTGLTFNIGEATGILKNTLYQNHIPFKTYPVLTIKKIATGSGKSKDATKENMLEAYQKLNNPPDPLGILDKDYPCENDIIDAFYALSTLCYEQYILGGYSCPDDSIYGALMTSKKKYRKGKKPIEKTPVGRKAFLTQF